MTIANRATAHSASTPAEPRPLLSAEDVARITGTTVRLARELIQSRRLPTVKVGRYVRVRPDDLEAYLEEHTRPAVARGGAAR